MKKTKVFYLCLGFGCSIVYGILIACLFGYIHNIFIGIASGFVSSGVVILASYHFLNYLVYRKYNLIIRSSNLEKSTIHFADFTTYQNPVQAFNLLIELASKEKELHVTDKFDNEKIIVISTDSGFAKWGSLIFIQIKNSDSRSKTIQIYSYHICEKEKNNTDIQKSIGNLITEYKKYDILDVGKLKN